MCDKFLIKELLQRIETSLKEIMEWTAHKVFDTLKEDVPALLNVIIKMREDLFN